MYRQNLVYGIWFYIFFIDFFIYYTCDLNTGILNHKIYKNR